MLNDERPINKVEVKNEVFESQGVERIKEIDSKKAFNSITRRILFVFICIVLPLCATNIVLINSINMYYQTKLIDSLCKDINSYIKNLENEMTTIINLQLGCLFSTDLFDLTIIPERLSQIQKKEKFDSLKERLQMIVNADDYIESISAHIPKINKTITTKNSLTLLQNEEIEELKELEGLSPYRLTYSYNNMRICMRYPTYEIYNESTSYLILDMSVQKIKSELHRIVENCKGKYMLLDSRNNKTIILYPNKDNIILNDFITYTKSKKFIQCIRGLDRVIDITENKNKDVVIKAQSDYVNIKVLFLIPNIYIMTATQYYFPFLTGMIILSLVIVGFVINYINGLIKKPIVKMIESFEKINEGNFDTIIQYDENENFRYLYEKFNFMTRKIKYLINEVYKKQMLTERAKYLQIQSQIKPHFLYNSLFIIYRMAKLEECDDIAKFALELGNYYKYIAQKDGGEVSISKEIEHVKRYVEIQRIRLNKSIKVIFEKIPDECNSILVPSLILQPLVENAYKYAFNECEDGGVVVINVSIENKRVCISVDDNGKGLSYKEYEKIRKKIEDSNIVEENSGILSIHRRIQFMYGPESGLKIGQSTLGGFRAEIVFNRKDDC